MTNRLEPIILQKKREVAILRAEIEKNLEHPLRDLLQTKTAMSSTTCFKQALRQPTLSIIAEIKRKSPSKGHLATIQDPVQLAKQYQQGGASALSILTDQEFFSGHINDLTLVSKALVETPLPLLRKDFIIDELQLAEARSAGANAVLLIVAVLGTEIGYFIECAKMYGLEALVEVHDNDELAIALECGAEIIGINNRDLKTFTVDTNRALAIAANIADTTIIKIAESGIHDPVLAHTYRDAGFDAVLIGESLVKSQDPQAFIRACKYE